MALTSAGGSFKNRGVTLLDIDHTNPQWGCAFIHTAAIGPTRFAAKWLRPDGALDTSVSGISMEDS